jgi:hypothetical protein
MERMAQPVKRETEMRRQDSTKHECAEKRGCDELMNCAEYVLQERPRALRHAREVYRTACLKLYAAIERHYRGVFK